jgi:hypothetical protein
MDRKEVVSQALTKALTFQSPVARNNVERLRRVHPDETPTELAKRVTRYYLSAVTTSGGAMGAAGAIPGGGLPSAAFDVVAFTEASVLYALLSPRSTAFILRTSSVDASWCRPSSSEIPPSPR